LPQELIDESRAAIEILDAGAEGEADMFASGIASGSKDREAKTTEGYNNAKQRPAEERK
jgi:hypothetical protein